MAKADEDFNLLSSVAELLGLDEGEADNFISSGMKRIGHKPKLSWEDAEDDGNSGSSDFFSARRERRETRSTGTRGSERGQRRENNDWHYGRRTG